MPRTDCNYVLTRDDTGAVGFMRNEPWEVDVDDKIVIAGVTYTMRSDVDATAYDSGPVEYDEGSNALIQRLADVSGVAGYKTLAKAQIDTECRRRILADTFESPPASGKLFSMSEYAQINWTGMAAMIGAGALDLAASPITVKTKDDSDEHVFDTDAAGLAACGAYMEKVQSHRTAMQTAKDDIDAATTKAGIDTVVADYLAS
jgi:hypothetical protein